MTAIAAEHLARAASGRARALRGAWLQTPPACLMEVRQPQAEALDEMNASRRSRLFVQPSSCSVRRRSFANAPCENSSSLVSPKSSKERVTIVSWSSGSGSSQRNV